MDTLEAIARDELEAEAAKASIADRIENNEQVETIYAAVARWTWGALISRRFDDDLRVWHRVLRDLSAMMHHKLTDKQPEARCYAERIEAFSDLLRISISMSEGVSHAEVIDRAHVVDILGLLAETPDTFVDRKDISEALELRSANLTRVLTLLVVNGLIERQARGRSASFRVTSTGLDALQGREKAELAKLRHTKATLEKEITATKQAIAAAKQEKEALLQSFIGTNVDITEFAGWLLERHSRLLPTAPRYALNRSTPFAPNLHEDHVSGGDYWDHVSRGDYWINILREQTQRHRTEFSPEVNYVSDVIFSFKDEEHGPSQWLAPMDIKVTDSRSTATSKTVASSASQRLLNVDTPRSSGRVRKAATSA